MIKNNSMKDELVEQAAIELFQEELDLGLLYSSGRKV